MLSIVLTIRDFLYVSKSITMPVDNLRSLASWSRGFALAFLKYHRHVLAQILATFWALLLPAVQYGIYFHRKEPANSQHLTNTGTDKQPVIAKVCIICVDNMFIICA